MPEKLAGADRTNSTVLLKSFIFCVEIRIENGKKTIFLILIQNEFIPQRPDGGEGHCNRGKPSGKIAPMHPSGKHHAKEHQHKNERRAVVARGHDKPNWDQGMDTEQQDGREFAYMILHCVEMHGKGDDEPYFH